MQNLSDQSDESKKETNKTNGKKKRSECRVFSRIQFTQNQLTIFANVSKLKGKEKTDKDEETND